VRATHFEIPSPNFFAPFSPILFPLRPRFKDVRATHFEIPSPNFFAPLSPIPFSRRPIYKEVRVTHFEIPSPNFFALFSPIRFQLFFKTIESIRKLGVYCSFSSNYYRFYIFNEILSSIGS